MSDEWGPWIKHDGKGCVVPLGVWCETKHADGGMDVGPSCGHNTSGWSWYVCVTCGKPGDKILSYRIFKPRALQELIKIIKNLPEKENTDA